MGVVSFVSPLPAEVGVIPGTAKLVTTDSLATITTAGYLNATSLQGQSIQPNNVVECLYSYNLNTNSGTYEIFTVSVSNGVVTLVQWANPGDVLLPVVSGDFAIFNGTTGQIKDAGYLPSNAAKTNVVMANGATIANHIGTYTDTAGTIGVDAATAINGGNIQAGLSGTAGTLASFPATGSKGSLVIAGVANTGNTNTTISNAAMGQASVISIPDPGTATSNFIIADSAGTQHITSGSLEVDLGNVIAGSSGHAGNLQSFPAGATSGELIVAAVTNSGGNFNTTISNASSVAQSQVVSIPDGGVAASNFIISNSSGTQTIATGNLALTVGNITATAGNLQAGSSGHAGTVGSFPGTASNGELLLAAVNNSGGFNTTISNSNIGQATVYSLPDVTSATGRILSAGSALISGNLNQSSGTAGAIVDSGLVALNVPQMQVFTLGFAALASAGKVNIQVHSSGTSQYFIQDIKVLTSTGLSGGGGNRLLAVSDGTLVWNNAGITAALLGTPIFTIWGGTGNPIAVSTGQVSTAGADIFFQYTGGTTDFTAGSVKIAITWVKVTA